MRPSKKWYIVAGIIFIACAFISIGIFINTIVSFLTIECKFTPPGTAIVHIKKPAKYTLWNESVQIHSGSEIKSSMPHDGVTIEIYELSSGRRLELKPDLGSWEVKSGSGTRYSIGNIHFDKRGEYKIEANGDFQETIFILRPSFFSNFTKILKEGLISLLLYLTGLITACFLAISIYIKRTKTKNVNRLQPIEKASVEMDQKSNTMDIEAEKNEKIWAMLSHLGTLLGSIIIFGNIILPLIILLTKGEESTFIKINGKESLNFQISMTIYNIISSFLILIIVGIFLLIGLGLFNFIVVIIATLKANEGKMYRYPLTIRFIN